MAAMESLRGITGLQQQTAVTAQNGSTLTGKTAGSTNTEVTTSTQSAAGMDKAVSAVSSSPTTSSSPTSSSSAKSESSKFETTQKQETEFVAKQNEQLRNSVDQINKSVSDTEVLFGYHDGTHQVILKIVDKTTKKVIRELPPEKTLDMIVKVWEMAGILVDEKR